MRSETIILFIVDFTIYRTIKDIKKEKEKMKIEIIRKKPTWEIDIRRMGITKTY